MKKQILLTSSFLLLLSGCGTANASIEDKSEPIMVIGDTTYTKEDEYDLLKIANGPSMTIELIRQKISDKVVGRGKDIMDAAKKQYDDTTKSYPGIAKQIKNMGYANEDVYIKKVIVPTVQATKLNNQYFEDAKEEIQKEYKPSLVKIIQCQDKDTAQKAIDALKNGTDFNLVFDQYTVQEPAFQKSETLISTQTTSLPKKLINTCYKAKENGLIDEVFTSDVKDDKTSYVVTLVSNDYDKNLESIKNTLSSNSNISNECLTYYLKKFNFEVHDQSLFDYLSKNNPDYLYMYPEIAQKNQEQQ